MGIGKGRGWEVRRPAELVEATLFGDESRCSLSPLPLTARRQPMKSSLELGEETSHNNNNDDSTVALGVRSLPSVQWRLGQGHPGLWESRGHTRLPTAFLFQVCSLPPTAFFRDPSFTLLKQMGRQAQKSSLRPN